MISLVCGIWFLFFLISDLRHRRGNSVCVPFYQSGEMRKAMLTKTRTSRKLGELLEDSAETLEKIERLQEILINLRYEGRHQLGKNLKQAEEVLDFFNGELMEHVDFEEEVIFPFIKSHIPKLEPLILLLSSEHEEFKKNLRSFEFWLNELAKGKANLDHGRLTEKVRQTGNYLTYLLQNHLQEESEVLYRIADQELRSDEKRELERRVRERLGGRG